MSESLQELAKDSAIKNTEYTSKLERQKELTEKYRSIAKTAVDKYIRSQAVILGVSASDIKGKLNENYSFSDIDRVCESLRNYKLNVSSLPFDTGNRSVKVKVTESVEPISRIANATQAQFDDEPDAQLMSITNL